jgi:uncharacterized protein YceK
MRKLAIVLVAGVSLSGCVTFPTHNRVLNGALIGGATGAVVGLVSSHNLGGTLIGAGIGAGAGAVIAIITH